MNIYANRLTKRELIKEVVLKGIPAVWVLDLKRGNNHNNTTLLELQKCLKSVDKVDGVERKFKEKNNNKSNHMDSGRDRSRTTINSDDKSCRKSEHEHKWKDYPDKRYGIKYQGCESHINKRRAEIKRDENQEQDEVYYKERSTYHDIKLLRRARLGNRI